jgi:hypothetical protein
LETNIKFAFAAAKKIQYEGIKSLSPSQAAVDEFQEYKDSLMKDLVWTGSCSSWYVSLEVCCCTLITHTVPQYRYKNGKVDGKVWGPWPGSSLHYLELMSSPRWEDFDIHYLSKNRFRFLGNGKTRLETEGGDVAYYLREPGAGQPIDVLTK